MNQATHYSPVPSYDEVNQHIHRAHLMRAKAIRSFFRNLFSGTAAAPGVKEAQPVLPHGALPKGV